MGLFYLQPSLMLGELFVDEEFLIFSFLGTYIPNFYFHKLDGYSWNHLICQKTSNLKSFNMYFSYGFHRVMKLL